MPQVLVWIACSCHIHLLDNYFAIFWVVASSDVICSDVITSLPKEIH
jgi:hypothetical protein